MGCCCSNNASYDISGNRIRGDGQLEHDLIPGSIRRRGRHVIKVFAQVFELVRVFGGEDSNDVVETNIDDEDQFDWLWNELCDVPVHVNLTCIQEGEIYEYAVYAEEKEICPFNSTITIPGTEIRKTGAYFVQWKDPYTGTVYGLNFFTEQEALRFLSSCFPPTFTPDMAVRRSTSAPSYPCPSPPAPVTDLPFLNKISNGRSGSDGLEDGEASPTQSTGGDTMRSSTPERDAEEFFNVVIGAIKPLRSYMMQNTPDELSGNRNGTGFKSFDTFDSYVANNLPNSESVASDLDERPLSVDSLPSPPSQFDLTNNDSSEGVNATIDQTTTKQSMEEETEENNGNGELDKGKNLITSESGDIGDHGDNGDSNDHGGDSGDNGDNGDDDIELYQRKGPVEYDKTLNDIPEEEEEEDMPLDSSGTSQSLSASGKRLKLKRMEKMVIDDEDEGEMNESADSSSLRHLSQSMSAESMNSTVQDFDRLLQDLEESELLEITMSEQKTGLSRQTSFIGQPPSLPRSLPPGPTLSASIEQLEGEFSSDQFKNALKRLSMTSLDNALLSDIPDLPESVPPGKLLSPQQSSADVTTNHTTQQDRNDGARFPTLSSLPPFMSMRADTFDEEEGSGLQRHASFLRHRFNPPEEFGSDSGVPHTDNESDHQPTEESEDQQLFMEKQSQLLQALRIADLNNKTKDSSPSTSPPSEGRDRRHRSGEGNWIMASKPLFGEEAITKDDSIIKSGWLEVKELLIRKNKKVAMKSRRKWKKYWALLKGVNLILYKWDSETLITDDTPYDSKLDVSGCLAYPVTNHMRRDYIFSLTTATGNTYYMEAICRSAADEWIQELHIASALAMTGKTIRGEALDKIAREIRKLEEDIQTARRMKNLAELQLTSTAENKAVLNRQIASFLEDTDRLNVDLYRVKCYQASLSGAELPNPQSILGAISKTTKNVVSKIGMYSVASLQSVMSTRYNKPVELPDSPSSLTVVQEQNTDVPKRKEKKGFRFFPGSSGGFGPRRKLKFPSPVITSPTATDHVNAPHLLTFRQILEPDPLMTGFGSLLTIQLYNGKTCEVPFKIDLTVGDVILICCQKYGLDPSDHFLLAEKDNGNVIPNEDIFINNLDFEYLSVKQKFIREVHFDSSVTVEDRGLTLKPDLRNLGAVTHALIGTVPPDSLVHENGLMEGDEVVLINDAAVSHMSWDSALEALKEPELSITVRMCRVNVPVGVANRITHVHLKDLVCPSPPLRDRRLSPEKIDNLIVPKPSDITHSISFEQVEESNDGCSDHETEEDETTLALDESERVKQLIKDYSEVSKLVGIWKAYDEAAITIPDSNEEATPGMTHPQRVRKCLQEIITTEIEHVKMLEVLVDRYLVPMQQEKFLPKEKMTTIAGLIQVVVVQQKQFKGRIAGILDRYGSEESDITPMLEELCESVEVHLDTFRHYSQFYAAQYELERLFDGFEDKQRLEQFFQARNPKQDPNFTLNNLLSKPILRLLRYPLYFKGIRDLIDKKTMEEEATLLDTAISSLMKVTEYINEVQRVTESYVSLFDQLLDESGLAEFGVSVRVSQLVTHTTAMWLNAKGPGMGKSWKKGQGPEAHCFVFESVLVVLCLEKKTVRKNISKASLKEDSVTINDVAHSILLPLAQCKANDLPDSDGVVGMWQIIHKSRQANSKSNTYIFRSKRTQDKMAILQHLNMAITEQLALYGTSGGLSGSKSPSMSTINSSVHHGGSPFKQRNNSLISRLTVKSDSVDSEYELTLL